MTESFDFRDPEFFTVGTLGPRGQRVFYLQARAEGQLVSLKLEKQQVSALADYLDRVLTQLPDDAVEPDDSDLGLREPVVAAWTVGSLAIAYAEEVGVPTADAATVLRAVHQHLSPHDGVVNL